MTVRGRPAGPVGRLRGRAGRTARPERSGPRLWRQGTCGPGAEDPGVTGGVVSLPAGGGRGSDGPRTGPGPSVGNRAAGPSGSSPALRHTAVDPCDVEASQVPHVPSSALAARGSGWRGPAAAARRGSDPTVGVGDEHGNEGNPERSGQVRRCGAVHRAVRPLPAGATAPVVDEGRSERSRAAARAVSTGSARHSRTARPVRGSMNEGVPESTRPVVPPSTPDPPPAAALASGAPARGPRRS